MLGFLGGAFAGPPPGPGLGATASVEGAAPAAPTVGGGKKSATEASAKKDKIPNWKMEHTCRLGHTLVNPLAQSACQQARPSIRRIETVHHRGLSAC